MENKKLFGNSVTPDCTYCSKNRGTGTHVQCPVLAEIQNSSRNRITAENCSAYSYDPLKRKPNTAPDFRSFTAEDFKL